MRLANPDEALRKKFVFSFFSLFTISLGISLISILVLFYASIISMDQSQALSDLRLVRMYLDIRYPGEWNVRGDSVFKGDIQVSGNYRIVLELAQYIRPDTRLLFHAGSVSDNVETLALHKMGFVMRLVISLKKVDHRLDIRFKGKASGKDHLKSWYLPFFSLPTYCWLPSYSL